MTGLDSLYRDGFEQLLGKKVGLVCNQATVTKEFRHILDILLPLHQSGRLKMERVFGPQHGLFGHTQDNMIEWEGTLDPKTGLSIVSLYGEHREPTPEMVAGLDVLVVDLPDIGSRYYTFLWTTAFCIKVAELAKIPILILDRPNPIGGLQTEGPVLQQDFASFVGLYPLPIRHGMTLGEVGQYLKREFFPSADLSVVKVEGWSRSDYGWDTDAPWVMPSPNMPTLDTALVYPGGCLFEGTNISEGRGTTHPFETVGAPYIDGPRLCSQLNELQLPGVFFRPVQFQPTFQKHAGQICEGCFIHAVDRRAFEPVLTAIAILIEIRSQCGEKMNWNPPPYEYEYEKLPIDILAGNEWLRKGIDALENPYDLRERMLRDCFEFDARRTESLIYT